MQTKHIQSGFSLTELMVGILVSLLASLAVFATLNAFSAQARNTVSAGDAQQNALAAINTLETTVRMSAGGIANLSCQSVNYYNAALSPQRSSFSARGVTIEPNTPSAGTDRITIIGSEGGYGLAPGRLSGAIATSDATLAVAFGGDIKAGDVLILAGGASDCSILQASQAVTLVGGDWPVLHAASAQYPWNPPAGQNIFPTTPSAGYTSPSGTVTNLGRLIRQQYYVSGGKLMVLDQTLPASSTNPQVLIEGIASIRAEYGRDTNADGAIDSFDTTTPAAKKELLAVRVGLVARSNLYEKTAVSLADIPFWPGDTKPFKPSGDDQRYRYVALSTVVPLRNSIWNQ
jgi:type IV pilus assembly protein PilW